MPDAWSLIVGIITKQAEVVKAGFIARRTDKRWGRWWNLGWRPRSERPPLAEPVTWSGSQVTLGYAHGPRPLAVKTLVGGERLIS
ncbi:hypothetical protein EVAR_46548_1 [Eumeta japonica]|uniref:Uncharacterized protein n=1 Tax=Eumeta variegata TaxID=151549 RepID=A0A4C1XR27_EUMVA|nr:hypothetical protein EVAR_46548_1 [Eumeta japonica]